MRLSPATSASTLTLTLTLAALLTGVALTGCTTYTTPSTGFVTAEQRRAYTGSHASAGANFRPARASTPARFRSDNQTQTYAQASPAPQAFTGQAQQSHQAPPTQPAAFTPPASTAQELRTPRRQPVSLPGEPAAPQPTGEVFTHNSAADLVPVAERPDYAAPSGGTPGQFSLYGQIPGQPAGRAASPMDAQDNLRRVTFTTEGADFDVEVDPSGQKLFFASTRHRETADLYVQNVGGTAVTQLTSDPANDVMPAISPDGKTLAFCSDRSGTWDIYLTDADGGQVVKLTNDDAHNIHPSFSRDGSQLVYSSYGSQSGVWELVLVDLARPTKKRIIGHGLFPVWSPTDDTVVFQRARERGSRWFSVWTVDIVDGEAVSPTEIAVSSNAAVITPEWSPDGQNIVFCTVIDPQNDDPSQPTRADVWVVNRDGSGRAKLTTGAFANLQPAWSAEGDIYFISDRGVEGVENIWAVRPGQAVYLARGQREAGETATADVPTP